MLTSRLAKAERGEDTERRIQRGEDIKRRGEDMVIDVVTKEFQ